MGSEGARGKIGKNGDSAAAGEKGPRRFADALSPWLLPPLPPGCLGRCCRGSWRPAMLPQGGEEKAFRMPKRLAMAGSKRTALRAQPYGRQQVWALEVTELKGALATPLRDFARPSWRAPRPVWRDREKRERCPRGSSILGSRRSGGGEQLYQAKHDYFPCLHVGKIQAPYGFSGAGRWLLASPRVSLE